MGNSPQKSITDIFLDHAKTLNIHEKTCNSWAPVFISVQRRISHPDGIGKKYNHQIAAGLSCHVLAASWKNLDLIMDRVGMQYKLHINVVKEYYKIVSEMLNE